MNKKTSWFNRFEAEKGKIVCFLDWNSICDSSDPACQGEICNKPSIYFQAKKHFTGILIVHGFIYRSLFWTSRYIVTMLVFLPVNSRPIGFIHYTLCIIYNHSCSAVTCFYYCLASIVYIVWWEVKGYCKRIFAKWN